MLRDWRFVAAEAAGTALRKRQDRARANVDHWHPEPLRMHGFSDERSRAQIGAYLAHRSRASDERNERNERALERWRRAGH
jgi:hypothetical protein